MQVHITTGFIDDIHFEITFFVLKWRMQVDKLYGKKTRSAYTYIPNGFLAILYRAMILILTCSTVTCSKTTKINIFSVSLNENSEKMTYKNYICKLHITLGECLILDGSESFIVSSDI
jgi:hypothetical protein